MSNEIKHVLSNYSAVYTQPAPFRPGAVLLRVGTAGDQGQDPYMTPNSLREMAKKLEEIAQDLEKPKFVPFSINVNTPEHAALLLGAIGPTGHEDALQFTNKELGTSFSNTREARDAVYADYLNLEESLKDYGRSR